MGGQQRIAGGIEEVAELLLVRDEVIDRWQQRHDVVVSARRPAVEQVERRDGAGPTGPAQHRWRPVGQEVAHPVGTAQQHDRSRLDDGAVDVVGGEMRVGAGDVEGGAVAVGPDRQDRRRRRRRRRAGDAGLDPSAPHQLDDEVARFVGAHAAERDDLGPELGEIDGRAGTGAGGGEADLLDQHPALAGWDLVDRPAVDVEDVDPDAHHPLVTTRHVRPSGDGPPALARRSVRRR